MASLWRFPEVLGWIFCVAGGSLLALGVLAVIAVWAMNRIIMLTKGSALLIEWARDKGRLPRVVKETEALQALLRKEYRSLRETYEG